MGRGGRRRTDGLRTGSRSSSSAVSTPTPRRNTSISGPPSSMSTDGATTWTWNSPGNTNGTARGRRTGPPSWSPRTVPTANASSSSCGTHGPARPRRSPGPGRASRPGNASDFPEHPRLNVPPGGGPPPSPGTSPPSVRRAGRAPRGRPAVSYRHGHDPDVTLPQADERAERDGALGALVGDARREPLPDVGQVRVLRRSERGRRLRLLAAVQVPDLRVRRGAFPGGCAGA